MKDLFTSCDGLMVTDRANAFLVCTRISCKRDYHTKGNSESRRRAMNGIISIENS